MDSAYALLLVIAGISFFLQIEWLLLATIFLFFALIFSRSYSDYLAPQHIPAQLSAEMAATAPQSQPPIVVMQPGGGAATITDSMIAQMMGTFMALDAYEKKDQAPQFKFLSRGMKMRQNMFNEEGNIDTKRHAIQREHSPDFISRLDKIIDKLEKKS